jgi:hypothetical protein
MSALRTANCPAWCRLDHSGESPISHEGHANAVPVAADGVQFLEVRTVQYVAEDSGTDDLASGHVPLVEIAHHVDGRYRLINLSSAQARALADALLGCADAANSALGTAPHGGEMRALRQ